MFIVYLIYASFVVVLHKVHSHASFDDGIKPSHMVPQSQVVDLMKIYKTLPNV